MLGILREIIGSYAASVMIGSRSGLPIGNLTSQLFANIYLDPLDQYVKHTLREKYYARYADDFVILGSTREHLGEVLASIRTFLTSRLYLTLHPAKVSIGKLGAGIDFLGYVLRPHHRTLRTKTKRRMQKRLSEDREKYLSGEIDGDRMHAVLASYLGVLSHANAYQMACDVWHRFFVGEG